MVRRRRGGEGALLNRCLLSPRPATTRRWNGCSTRPEPRNREVEVYALDALARIAANGETERAHGSCWTGRSRWHRPSSTSSTTTTVSTGREPST